MPEQLIIRETIDNIVEQRKRVILLQEVGVGRLAIAHELATQCWALKSAERSKLTDCSTLAIIMFCNCQTLSGTSCEASLCSQPCML